MILGALGAPIMELIHSLKLSLGWITFITTAWYVFDYVIAVLIYVYFKVKKEGISWRISTLRIGLGIGILVIITAFGVLFVELIAMLGFSFLWTTTIGIAYYATESLIAFSVIHYFKIPIEDIPDDIIPGMILTEVDGATYDADVPITSTDDIPENITKEE